MDPNTEQIVNLSYGFFGKRTVTPELIRDYLSRAKNFYPEFDFNEDELFGILEEKHSVRIDDSGKLLEDSIDHEEWFNPDTNNLVKGEPIEWKFWRDYEQYLINSKHWTKSLVTALDQNSSVILSRMENPKRPGKWNRRGMVVGGVQSGKTSNYTAVITKAADAGYKLFIVLAGSHNSLRSQTQDRLNHEFLGHELDTIRKVTDQERKIGVWKMFPDHPTVNTLTSNAEDGDFKAAVVANAGITPSPTGDPIIMIVKKHVSILENVINWATGLGQMDKSGRRVVSNVPLVLIDDECDYASVNTKRKITRSELKEMAETDPTKTNMKIRDLLMRFEKSIYIGYTATPYANIFIDRSETHSIYGDDLFPRHFILSLPKPTNYIGPEDLFGLKEDPDVGIDKKDSLPLLKVVKDSEKLIPPKHKSDLAVDELPDSLLKSIKFFIIACAVRRIRSTGVPHNTMLIHVTRFNSVQKQVRDLVSDYLKTLNARIMSGTDPLNDFEEVWNDEEVGFVKVSAEMFSRGYREATLPPWNTVKTELFSAVRSIRVRLINGKAKDTLEYRNADRTASQLRGQGKEVPWTERGASVIAIGGDKLSRGLTLEGLSISYYLRSAGMYDTLLQMGRWFGYHDGYNDLCRLFTTQELVEWYSHIALADKELLNELEYMEATSKTPETFGLKVRDHPGRLAVTSSGKSRKTERLKITFANRMVQTLVYSRRDCNHNFQVLETLVSSIGREPDFPIRDRSPRIHWTGVDPDLIINFLENYRTHREAIRVADPSRYAEYIKRQVEKGELTTWDVVLISNPESEGTRQFSIMDYNIRCVERQALGHVTEDKVSIGVLTSPADELLDLNENELRIAYGISGSDGEERKIPSVHAIRHARPPTRGLLLIYFPQSLKEGNSYGINGDVFSGFAISFPNSENVTPITYIVNSIYTEEQDE